MTSPHHDFNDVAATKAPKYPPPFSLRLTFEERARLEQDAAGMSLGAYIRSKLFGDDVPPRRTRGKFPVKDKAALAKVLAVLGASRLSQNLNQLARAVNIGAFPVTPEKPMRNCAKPAAQSGNCALSFCGRWARCRGASHDPQGFGTQERRRAGSAFDEHPRQRPCGTA